MSQIPGTNLFIALLCILWVCARVLLTISGIRAELKSERGKISAKGSFHTEEDHVHKLIGMIDNTTEGYKGKF